MNLPARPVTRRDVEKFIDHCVKLRGFWTHYHLLFEGSELQRELLQSTAPSFFSDLNTMLVENLILQICKLTDSEGFVSKKVVSRNLTVQFLIKNADFAASTGERAKLDRIAARIEKFSVRIRPARNKLIGHLDLEAALRSKSLGGASVAAWHRFWLDLQDFVSIMHKRYIDEQMPFYLNSVLNLSDADQLVMALKESKYFHAVLNDKTLTSHVSNVAFKSQYYRA